MLYLKLHLENTLQKYFRTHIENTLSKNRTLPQIKSFIAFSMKDGL